MSQVSLHIRWMIPRDMPAVLTIEREVFAHPWREQDFRGCLRRRECVGMVVQSDDAPLTSYPVVVGFMVYAIGPTSLRLLNLAVASDVWRRGIGRMMIDYLVGKLRGSRRAIIVEISERNLRGQIFFRRCGFRCTMIRRQAFRDSDDDGYRMVYFSSGRREPAAVAKAEGREA